MEEADKLQKKLPNQEFDYFKIGKILISRWYWVALSVIVCMIVANIYLWWTPKTYSTSATMKLEERKSDISDLVNIMGSEKGPSKTQSEIFILQSAGLIRDAIKDLDYQISFYVEGRLRTRELYPEKPLAIKLIRFDSLKFYNQLIAYKPINATTYNLTYQYNGKEVKNDFTYNNPVNIGPTTFSISYPGEIKNTVYLFKFNTPDDFVGRAKGGLQIGEAIKNSNIISLVETDSNPQFAADVLNAIMNEYLKADREHKQQSATKIIHFIDEQLDTISNKVKRSESAIGEFKKSSQIMDVTSSAQLEVNKANSIETDRNALKMQLNSIQGFKQQLIKAKDNISLNFNIDGGNNQLITTLINNLNNLFLQRATLLKTYISTASPVVDVNNQIAHVKNDIMANVNLAIANTQKKIDDLNAQLAQVTQKISTFPDAERSLVSLNRDFEINEKVYNLLSEKDLDAQISRSSILPGATIIEQAQVNNWPISPNEPQVRQTGIVMGLLIGIGMIVLIRVLNPYIYDKETIESLTTTPIIGVIRKFPQKLDENSSEILVLSQPKSVFAESVRSVRTNLSFLAAEKLQKVICVTSEVAGEGKSFVAVNIASTLALIDKKIILIAADLRRSKLHKTFHVPNDVGLSNFLANQNTIDEIIIHTNQSNLDFIPSGPVPPNPSELLHTDRMTYLIDVLKRTYDIVMIDTAPVGLVSDSIPLIRASDINVFVIRSGKSKFNAATIPQRISLEYQLSNSVIVLNAFEEDLLHSRFYSTKFTGDTHGGGYYYSDYVGYESSGYYIDSDKKKWWNIRGWFK
jgi:tyrosine-protein kinase Etk/Wzc